MKKFILWVRLNPLQTTNTIIFANNALEAKWLGEAQYGFGSVLNYQEADWNALRGLNIGMRFYEIRMIKPVKPLNPQQARIASLKKGVEDAKRRLQAEKQKVIKPIKPTHLA